MQNDLTLEIINERFTEEEIKDMMEGKDEAIGADGSGGGSVIQ